MGELKTMKKENLKKYYVFFKDSSYKVIFAESYIQAVAYFVTRGYDFVHIDRAI